MSRKPGQLGSERALRARGVTLIELIVMIVLLALLTGVAIPRYIDYTAQAKESSDRASISGIRVALCHTFVYNRVNNAGSGWVLTVSDIASTLAPPQLPDGITINGAQLQDRRGNLYDFTPETASSPARVQLAAGSPGP
jgi:type II secretory pathway pseudopilin PulG